MADCRVHPQDGPDSSSDSEYESDSGNSTPPTAAATLRTPRPSELKVHHCPHEGCTKSFNRLSRLTEHERSHTGQRIFKCKEQGCNKDFLRESHLKHHIKSAHTDIRDYVCNWEGCDKKFATGTRLRRHIASHEGKEKYRCRGYDGCNQTFRKHATLTRHILTVHEGQKAFPCLDDNLETGKQCNMAFDTAEKLRAHQRAQHDPTRFSCTICLDAMLAMNIQDYSTLTVPEIDTSQAYFPTYALLQAHTAEAHPPTCPHCLRTCSTQRELRRHIEGIHGMIDPSSLEDPSKLHIFSCTYPGCTSSFTRKSNLNVHFNAVHKGRRSFVCGATDLTNSKNVPITSETESCGRSFTSKSSLEEHVRTAHLGLLSKQMERKLKRKATAVVAASSSLDDNDHNPKPKAKRRKTTKSILSNLTGVREDDTGTTDDVDTYGGYFPVYTDFDHEDRDDGEDDIDDLEANVYTADPDLAGPDYARTDHAHFGPAIDPLLLLT